MGVLRVPPGEKLHIPLENGLAEGKGAQTGCFSLKQNKFSSAQNECEDESECLTSDAGSQRLPLWRYSGEDMVVG